MSASPVASSERVSLFSLLSLSLPVAMGYVPLGAVFGFLLVQAGAAWWIGPLMSVAVYAGAAQFMAVPLLAAGVPLVPIAIATLVINLRHMFYGLSLLQRTPANRWARGYLIWTLTDETFSLITALPERTRSGQIVGVAALNQFWWFLGTVIGTVVGARVTTAWSGIDFALAALFAVLMVEQWRAARTLLPIAVAAVAYFAASWVIPSQALVVAIALCVIAGVVVGRPESAAGGKP